MRPGQCKTREQSHAEVIGSLGPFLITFSLYSGGGFLAADTAPPGLYGLEAIFEHGTVGAFNCRARGTALNGKWLRSR